MISLDGNIHFLELIVAAFPSPHCKKGAVLYELNIGHMVGKVVLFHQVHVDSHFDNQHTL